MINPRTIQTGVEAADPTAANGTPVEVLALPAFNDNYLWLLHDGTHAVAVDPGDAGVISAALEMRGLKLAAILVTHHHPDHVGGVLRLRDTWQVPVYGPRAEVQRIAGLTQLLDEPDSIHLSELGLDLEVLAVPGHTLGHIAYYAPWQGWLFCGDTLFAGGCGRLFEGTPAQMHASLQKLAALPPATAVFCAHEYTLANLAFARAVEPDNTCIDDEISRVQALRAVGQPSVPSTLARERQVNPFLRCDQPQAVRSAGEHAGERLADEVAVFAELRRWKDGFRAAM